MPLVVSRVENNVAIHAVANRIRRFAETIQQAHRFGFGPGEADQLWKIDFQRQAVPVYATGLSWGYLVDISIWFKNTAYLMAAASGPLTNFQEWTHMHDYLHSASVAISESAPLDLPSDDSQPDHKNMMMPYDRLGKMVSADGAEGLREIGLAIELNDAKHQPSSIDTPFGHRYPVDKSPLTGLEMEWMQGIIAGERLGDIANRTGYSERSLYRALSRLRERLGVSNNNEAIALAVANKWIEHHFD